MRLSSGVGVRVHRGIRFLRGENTNTGRLAARGGLAKGVNTWRGEKNDTADTDRHESHQSLTLTVLKK